MRTRDYATALSAVASLLGAIMALAATSVQFGWTVRFPAEAVEWASEFDLLGVMARFKFEISAVCGIAVFAVYAITHRAALISSGGIVGAALSFLAGWSVPVGIVFLLVAFMPSRLEVLADFREYLIGSGIVLFLLSFLGIRHALATST